MMPKDFYHKIALPDGTVTPGIFPLELDFYKLPDSFVGKRVLDVGAWDGFFTFEALKRGAESVLAIDDFSDAIYPHEKRSWEKFDYCRKAFGYSEGRCARQEMSVYDLATWEDKYDVVFFLGVAYHLRHVMLGLDAVRHVCAPNALLIVESHICDDYSPYEGGFGHGHGEKVVMEFYPGKQLAGCQTNWWAPTLKCLANMVEAAGFKDVKAWKIDSPDQLPYCRGFVQAIAG